MLTACHEAVADTDGDDTGCVLDALETIGYSKCCKRGRYQHVDGADSGFVLGQYASVYGLEK